MTQGLPRLHSAEAARGPAQQCRHPWRTLALAPLMAHPWLRMAPDALFLVPVELLEGISSGRGPEDATTDLGDGTIEQFPLGDIWQSILSDGMRDPLVIALGLAPGRATIRLESGNHRIWPARKSGLTHLPAVGLASARSILNRGNGDHWFDFDRSGLDAWLVAGGRPTGLFEPYPHPVDLRAALAPMEGGDRVFAPSEVVLEQGPRQGIVEFSC